MRVFISGVMQGQRQDDQIEPQSYRQQIASALQEHLPGVQIIDPYALHPESVSYDGQLARRTFYELIEEAGQADILIAYLPSLSMGTAMEMWQAYQANAYIVVVTPFVHHWAIRFTADEILPDLESLTAAISSGRLRQAWQERSRPRHEGY
jgi:hypothetical protein